jgi:predicted nucleic acid-binding protein
MPTACIDANVALKWYLPEEHREQAWAILAAFQNGELDLVAPNLIAYEIASVLRGRVARGELSVAEGSEVLREFLGVGKELAQPEALTIPALSLATELGIWTYDATYLIAAQAVGGELWTADERLWKQTSPRFAWVRRLQDYDIPI